MNEELIRIAERCGLVFTGEYEEEMPQFIGTDKQFEKYAKEQEELLREEQKPF